MTTIVVVRKGDEIAIAADSLTTFGDTRLAAEHDRTFDKIVQYRGTYIGLCGSAAHQLVFESMLRRHEDLDFSNKFAIFETFRKLHPILKEQHFLNPKEEEDDPYESTQITGLLANEHGIFGVFSMREVFEYTRYWAAGSGREFALGAMQALYPRLKTAAAVAKAGLEAGAMFDKNSALPLTLYTVKLKAASLDPSGPIWCSPRRRLRRPPPGGPSPRGGPSVTDTLTRFVFEHAAVRGALVTLPDTVRAVLACHRYPPPLQRVLAELVAATALLASTLKFTGSLIMQLQGDGPVRLLVVECTEALGLRATAQWDAERIGALGSRCHARGPGRRPRSWTAGADARSERRGYRLPRHCRAGSRVRRRPHRTLPRDVGAAGRSRRLRPLPSQASPGETPQASRGDICRRRAAPRRQPPWGEDAAGVFGGTTPRCRSARAAPARGDRGGRRHVEPRPQRPRCTRPGDLACARLRRRPACRHVPAGRRAHIQGEARIVRLFMFARNESKTRCGSRAPPRSSRSWPSAAMSK